jgi:hypothetical protein
MALMPKKENWKMMYGLAREPEIFGLCVYCDMLGVQQACS